MQMNNDEYVRQTTSLDQKWGVNRITLKHSCLHISLLSSMAEFTAHFILSMLAYRAHEKSNTSSHPLVKWQQLLKFCETLRPFSSETRELKQSIGKVQKTLCRYALFI